MKYIYESIQSGVFNFTIPGEDKTVQLFLGSKVTVKQKLAGGYLRVLKLIEEVDDEIVVTTTSTPKAKVADKITKVEEQSEICLDTIEIKTADSISLVKEEIEKQQKPQKRPIVKKKIK